MNRVGRLAVAGIVSCSIFVALIIVLTGAAPLWGLPIGLAWVACGYHAATRINRERADCDRPEMPASTEHVFLFCGPLSLAALLTWKTLDVVVYGR